MHRFYNLLTSWGPVGVGLFALTESLGVPNPGGTDLLLVLMLVTYVPVTGMGLVKLFYG